MSEIYLVSEGEAGPVKLGRSFNPDARFSFLQTGNPRPLRMRARWLVPASRLCDIERELLNELSEFSMIGEWLRIDEASAISYILGYFRANGIEAVDG